MVSTATPAVLANCSIRYSMSTYSNNRRQAGRLCLARRVPVVHAVEPLRVRAVGPSEKHDRVDVVIVVVVMKDGLPHVARRAVAGEQARGGQDRVVGVHDVADLAVLPPGISYQWYRAH